MGIAPEVTVATFTGILVVVVAVVVVVVVVVVVRSEQSQ